MFTKDFKEKYIQNYVNQTNRELYNYLQSVNVNDADYNSLSIGFLIKKIAELEFNLLMYSQTKK